jgi:hypothetical protein
MKKYLFFCITAFGLLFATCGRKGDLSGNLDTAGTLFFKPNPELPNDSVPLPGFTLYLQSSNKVNAGYLYSVQTDSNGKYLFVNLDKHTQYWITASLDTAGLISVIDQKVTPGNGMQDLTFVPNTNGQNGLVLYLVDSLLSPISFDTLLVFKSEQLADDLDSTGNIFTLVTDINGYARMYNIDSGEYYFNVKDTLLGNVLLKGRDSTYVSLKNVTNHTMKLQ